MAFTAAQTREYRRVRRDSGRCVRCGKLKASTVKTANCDACQEHIIMRQRQLRARRRAAGKCQYCNAPVADGSSYCCSRHGEEKVAMARRKRIAARETGRCTHCGKTIDDCSKLYGYVTCAYCRDKDNAQYIIGR